jgi:hypothetical protein
MRYIHCRVGALAFVVQKHHTESVKTEDVPPVFVRTRWLRTWSGHVGSWKPRRAPLPRMRLIRCSHPDHAEGAGCTWPNGMLPFRCAGCSTRLGVTEEIQLQTFRACAAGPEKVFLMCDDCTRTAIAALQFLRCKNHREAHIWVLNILKRDGRMRERWKQFRML